MITKFDVIVVGAGHAGCEAAWAAARLGSEVALCTLSASTVATMPCNPAVGGTAKGQLVREIDALGGLMGRAIDATGIQFKVLNRSRGPAVWAPRAQADKKRYAAWVRQALAAEPAIQLVEGVVSAVTFEGRVATGVTLLDGRRLTGRAVVVTAGTFLNGLIHVGDHSEPAGPGQRGAVHPPRRAAPRPRPALGPAENRDTATAVGRVDRLRGRRLGRPVPRGTGRRDADAAVVCHPHSRWPTASAAGSCTRPGRCTTPSAGTSAVRRSTTGGSKASARAIARPSRTR